ncbi:response regulator [Bosea caraganae]|uniref:Response regulator n=1 Tax=Bosea caraganae TaxID=2763117 RepID=A0A370LBA9_9HYPH|nr:response regulator [Bosea caraganae]RDJ27247.1 response regulator [Bosea caraganae]RDJ29263.1 response regulator [Bosea caraganae]
MATRKAVLVVDDDPNVLKSIGRLLKAARFDVIAYASAEELYRCSNLHEIACFVLDIHLNSVSGLDLRRHLEVLGVQSPVIFITADDSSVTRDRALASGCSEYLIKPFQAKFLLKAIEDAMEA